MKFEEWVETVPEEITKDILWTMKAYRFALFAVDLGWQDVTKLMDDKRTIDLSNQLYRSLGSISANIAEGYSRGTGRDRARFYEYALGSARESRGWYYQGREILGEKVASHRLSLITEIIRLLLTMVPQQRGRVLYDDRIDYQPEPNDYAVNQNELEELSRPPNS
jgi:four helix bundle protein